MKNLNKTVKTITLAIILLFAGAAAWAQSKFTVTSNGNTFTITRTTNTTTTETVYYRTVSLSALAQEQNHTLALGNKKHLTQSSGPLNFDPTHNSVTVSVQEVSNSIEIYTKYRYQNGTTRSYRFEVYDIGGFELAHCDRNISYSTNYRVVGNYLSTSITDLVKFTNGNLTTGMGSGTYYDVSYSPSSNSNHVTSGSYIKIDDGYDYDNHTLCTIPTSTFFTQVQGSQIYFNDIDCKLYATVYFTMKEEDDGYQYIQILTDNSSTYDDKDDNGKITEGPETSLYKACFELSKTKPKYVTEDHKMFFPHKSNSTHYSASEFDYSDAYLWQQAFKSSSYSTTNSGSLVLKPTVNNINVRFDAAGDNDDTWYVKDLKVRFALCDSNAPTVLEYKVSEGCYALGNKVYVSVAFNEIVKVTGAPYLTTTWGNLGYTSGSGSNVLTFGGNIESYASGTLNVTGYNKNSGSIKDLAGNPLSNSSNIINHNFNNASITSSYNYPINYSLNGGVVTPSNPNSYTWETAEFTLNNPTKTGYTFTGWTGSNGNTPQTTVTILTHSHGAKNYTANWTANTYSVRFNANKGVGEMANQSFSYDETKSLTANGFTREGYLFTGWNTMPDGSGTTYTDQQSVTNLTDAAGGTIDLYAQWIGDFATYWHADANHDGTTEARSYIITTTTGLNLLSAEVSDGLDFKNKFFTLGGDISFNSNIDNNFVSIGKRDDNNEWLFNGTFDGRGHTISGIKITSGEDDKGLFGAVGLNGTIKNVTLSNTRITGRKNVGGIAGYSAGRVENCRVTNTVCINATVTQSSAHGGIVGYAAGSVKGCISSSSIMFDKKTSVYGITDFGGIVGYLMEGERSEVTDCFAIDVVVSGSNDVSHAAAIIGNCAQNTDYVQRNCFHNLIIRSNDGDVKAARGFWKDDACKNPEGQAEESFILNFGANVINASPSTTFKSYDYGGLTIYKYGNRAVVTYGGTSYYPGGVVITVGNTGVIPTGYIAPLKGYILNDTDIDGNSFSMPSKNSWIRVVWTTIDWTGSGTEADPNIILYPSQLDLLAYRVKEYQYSSAPNDYSHQHYRLGADLTYDGTENNFTSIGGGSPNVGTFSGTFDGNGHTISGINLNRKQDKQGLFGATSGATVKNLILANCSFSGNDHVGGIIGYMYGGRIINCRVESSVTVSAGANSVYEYGSIAGTAASGAVVEGCISSAKVLHNNKSGCYSFGLFVGLVKGLETCIFKNNLAINGAVSAKSTRGIIVGSNESGNFSNNYYNNCILASSITTNIGSGSGDITSQEGAVEAVSFAVKPPEIGAQIASYSLGLTIYEHGAYYNGVYYLNHNLENTSKHLSLVLGTKDGATAYWGTFYDGVNNNTLSDGAAAYTMGPDYKLYRLGTNGRTVPKNTAVVIISATQIVSATPSGTEDLSVEDHCGGNILKGSDSAISVTAIGSTPYVFSIAGSPAVPGFYRYAGTTVPAGKAYYTTKTGTGIDVVYDEEDL